MRPVRLGRSAAGTTGARGRERVVGVAERHAAAVGISAVSERMDVVSLHTIERREAPEHGAASAGGRERPASELAPLRARATSRVRARLVARTVAAVAQLTAAQARTFHETPGCRL